MDGMSRERRAYYALEVDEDDAYSKSLKERRNSRLQSKRVADARESLLCFLPILSTLCSDKSLSVAYDDLEEKYFSLEERWAPSQPGLSQRVTALGVETYL